jgi:hypothetical protein
VDWQAAALQRFRLDFLQLQYAFRRDSPARDASMVARSCFWASGMLRIRKGGCSDDLAGAFAFAALSMP